ncbi:hypothetical protein GCM10009611_23990 [Arthrobacter roseus]
MMAAILTLLTGLYSLITRRPSWAGLTGRKVALVTVGFSLVGLMVGGALLPAGEDTVPTAVAEPTSSATPSPTPMQTVTSTPTPSPTPTPTPADTAPVDGDDVAAAAGDPVAPQNQPEYGVRALALLETLAVKGRAPKTGYDREEFGRACHTRVETVTARAVRSVDNP